MCCLCPGLASDDEDGRSSDFSSCSRLHGQAGVEDQPDCGHDTSQIETWCQARPVLAVPGLHLLSEHAACCPCGYCQRSISVSISRCSFAPHFELAITMQQFMCYASGAGVERTQAVDVKGWIRPLISHAGWNRCKLVSWSCKQR